MPLTPIQHALCVLLSEARRDRGDSYVAGGVALNELVGGLRRSHDVDLFHDTEAALAASWDLDRALLEAHGFGVTVVRERPSYVQARVRRDAQESLVEWVHDSAYRFFPLVEHPVFGLALHPFDLATNKLLALVGRREPRDWIDTLRCHHALQPLGYLAWAAAGKDPGFSPLAILNEARRSVRYTQADLDGLDFEGATPAVDVTSRSWHAALDEAKRVVEGLPAEHAGASVLDDRGSLCVMGPEEIAEALDRGGITFHAGRIRGAWPTVR